MATVSAVSSSGTGSAHSLRTRSAAARAYEAPSALGL